MPMRSEGQRQFGRLLRQERIRRLIGIAPPFVIGIGLFAGLIWLHSHGGGTWMD